MRHLQATILTVVVALTVATCSGPSTPTPAGAAPTAAPPAAASGAPAAGASAVTIAGFAFAPATITVSVGTTVTWTNNDSTGHTVTADDGSFASGTLAPGATFSQAFTTAGTFAYHCSIHSSMQGTVTVR
jgi:plastocyanin